MRLKFDAQDWMHVLMAVRIAQKVLTSGEHKTSAWETQRGRHILDELTLLIKSGPNPAPQVATKLDLSHLGGMMPDKHTPLVASSTSNAEAAAAAKAIAALTKRAEDMETRIVELMTRPAPPPAAPSEGAAVDADLTDRLTKLGDQNVRIFEFLATLEDRIMALERKRKL